MPMQLLPTGNPYCSSIPVTVVMRNFTVNAVLIHNVGVELLLKCGIILSESNDSDIVATIAC
jgi:hypothetical protein